MLLLNKTKTATTMSQTPTMTFTHVGVLLSINPTIAIGGSINNKKNIGI